MKCEIIRDLLPLYIDEVCSNESKYEVEKHLKNCDNCTHIFKQMNIEVIPMQNSTEILNAKKPFNIIRRKNIINISLAVIITIFIMIIGYMIIQDVGIVHDIIFPQKYVIVHENENIDIWNEVKIEEDNFLNFDSLIFKKCITNDANSNATVLLRITDESNNIILDNIMIEPGKTIELKELKRNKNYILLMKKTKGNIILNFS